MGRRSNRNIAGQKVERIQGRSLVPLSGSTIGSFNITPALFTRASGMADLFQFYRFTKLKFIHTPTGVEVVSAFVPGSGFDNAPTNRVDVIELPIAVMHGPTKTVDTPLVVPTKELLGDAQIKWWKTVPGTPASQFEIQGVWYYAVNVGAAGALVVLEWEIEFQSWNMPNQSPKPQLLPPSGNEKNSDFIVVGGMTYRKASA